MTATLQAFPDRQNTYNWPPNCGNAILILTSMVHQLFRTCPIPNCQRGPELAIYTFRPRSFGGCSEYG